MSRSSHATERAQSGSSALGLFFVFSAVVLVPVVVLGFVLITAYRNDSLHRTLSDGTAQADVLAQSGILPIISRQDMSKGLDLPALADLGAAVDNSVQEQRVVRLQLIGKDGKIIFPPATAGQMPDDPDLVADALRGRTAASVEELTGKRAAVVGYRGRVISVYRPIVTADRGTVGVMEVMLPHEKTAAAISHQVRVFTGILAGGLFALYVLIGGISYIVTSRLRRQIEINERLALHDNLTGLPNRALFRERAIAALDARKQRDDITVLAIVDLDKYKQVNDKYGHHCGDELLIRVAAIVREHLRADDTIARLGGDEFGIVLPRTDSQAATRILAAIRDQVRRPLTIGESLIQIDASIGVAQCPADGDDIDTLLQNADSAMYLAKAAGGGVVQYSAAEAPTVRDRLTPAAQLRMAMDSGELRAWYQPKLRLADGKVTGVEALIRWEHPQRGLLPPGEFLPVAEETGLMDDITEWMLRQTLIEHADSGLEVAVNVPPRTFHHEGFVDTVRRVLGETGIDPRRLSLEMTETTPVQDVERAAQVMTELRAMGIGISLDDFGSGNTSLAYLQSLPLTELKLDISLIEPLGSPGADMAIVEGLVVMAHRIGLRVVAEGVSSWQVADLLSDIRCDVAQGYAIAKPMPIDKLADWLAASPASKEGAVS